MNQHQPSLSRLVKRLISSAAIGIMLAPLSTAFAGYPAVMWKTVSLQIPAKSCMNYLGRAIKASGFDHVEVDSNEVRGTTANERAFAMCINLPKAGACNGSGSVATFVVASTASGDKARELVDRMVKAFGRPQLIDCG